MPFIQTVESAITQIPMVEQFFLNSLGLLGILALIPLAIFYLVKPEPEEQVMPSIRFFGADKDSGKLKNALRTFSRNLLLLLQILAVLGFTAALAQPYVTAYENPERTVVIFDRSASMAGSLDEARRFVENHLGEKNTLIVVGSESSVKAVRASASEVMDTIEGIELHDTETDLVSALRSARNYPGRVVIASDMGHTAGRANLEGAVRALSSRPVDIQQINSGNSWGITDIEVNRNTTVIGIRNFREKAVQLTVEKGEKERKIRLSPGETVYRSFENKEGENTVKLPEDEMEADNVAYYVVPGVKEIHLNVLGPGNPFFATAIDLIDGVSFTNRTRETDVYVLNSRLESEEMLEKVEKHVRSGGSAIVFGKSRVLSRVMGFNTNITERHRSVRLNYPNRISVGATRVVTRGLKEGKSLSSPEDAVKILEYGKGRILLYGLAGERFRNNIMYPVFWKHVIRRIEDSPSIEELNIQTGEKIDTGRKQVEINRTGFHTYGGRTYAANLVSVDESTPSDKSYEINNGGEELQKVKKDLRKHAISMLLVLILVELGYLWYRGDL
ncbi:MAG: VWA domain-containing protein [Candidatus Nanosalina sp.]